MTAGADLTGRVFGKLTVAGPGERYTCSSKDGPISFRRWLCKCVCGTQVLLTTNYLKSGRRTACVECNLPPVRSSTRLYEYRSFRAMHERCSDDRHPYWHRYGGRGISVCERWHHFPNFVEDMGKRPIGLSLDRINNDGNYEPENCRWATRAEQNSNKSTARIVTAFGKTASVTEWAKTAGISRGAMYTRLKKGLDAERTVSVPARPGQRFNRSVHTSADK